MRAVLLPAYGGSVATIWLSRMLQRAVTPAPVLKHELTKSKRGRTTQYVRGYCAAMVDSAACKDGVVFIYVGSLEQDAVKSLCTLLSPYCAYLWREPVAHFKSMVNRAARKNGLTFNGRQLLKRARAYINGKQALLTELHKHVPTMHHWHIKQYTNIASLQLLMAAAGVAMIQDCSLLPPVNVGSELAAMFDVPTAVVEYISVAHSKIAVLNDGYVAACATVGGSNGG